jgi:cystathionine beta-lyase
VSAPVERPDPFGLRSLEVDHLRDRPGAKWHRPGGLLAAWVADMDFPVAPTIRERLSALVATDLGYPDWERAGTSPLPLLFAERMQHRCGWSLDPGRLHELCDVMQGVQMAVHHLSDPGDTVVLHTPAYPPFLESLEQMGRRVLAVPWPFDHDALEQQLIAQPARLMILCHPHNPTGHVFDESELIRLGEIAQRHGLRVISDEIHADLTHGPHRHIPFASLAAELSGRTVTVTSASKAFNLAGLRWAILHAGSAEFNQVLHALPQQYLGAPNLMAVAAIEEAWSSAEPWLDEVLQLLEENRSWLADALARHLPGARYHVPDATYLAWIDCRGMELGEDPATVFRRRGVELSPGPRFGTEGAGHVRLNFATSPAILEQIVTAMSGEDQAESQSIDPT